MNEGGDAPVSGLELGCLPATPTPAPPRLDLVWSKPGTN